MMFISYLEKQVYEQQMYGKNLLLFEWRQMGIKAQQQWNLTLFGNGLFLSRTILRQLFSK